MMTLYHHKVALTTVFVVGLNPWAMATEKNISSQTLSPALEEVSVYARKRQEPIDSVPLTVSAFGRSQLQASQISGLNEIERLTPK